MTCPHGPVHSDAAKRAADNVNMHYAAIGWEAVGKFVAIALQDGWSDHNLYDTYRDAVRHVSNEKRFTFIKILPMQMTACEAQIMLDFKRKANDAGFNVADPDDKKGGRDIVIRGRPREVIQEQVRQLGRN